MDASRLLNNDDFNCTATSTSMYLSFDEESTISATFKTLDTINEVSDTSNVSICSQSNKNRQVNNIRETRNSPLKESNSFIRKNIMDFNIVSSTPSKGLYLKDDVRKADVGHCEDIKIQSTFPYVIKSSTNEANKENLLVHELDEASSVLSTCETASATIEETVTEMSINCDEKILPIKKEVTYKNTLEENTKDLNDVCKDDDSVNNKQECQLQSVYESTKQVENKIDNNSKNCLKYSIKPSRILPPGHRKTMHQIKKSNNRGLLSSEGDIEELMEKMLKIAEPNKTDSAKITTINHLKSGKKTELGQAATESKYALTDIPALLGEKSRYNYLPRRSVLVKTAHSPVKMAARKSLANGISTAQQNRSVLPTKINENLKLKNSPRRTIWPKTNNTPNSLSQLKERALLLDDKLKKCKQMQAGAMFVCNICKEKFTIKAIMEAHKRSHEFDKPFGQLNIKNSVSTTVSSEVMPPQSKTLQFGHNNQCKYCDKKFALVRTLHIHLLQNCPKIPPSEKRKLEFTEMDHVTKAQLPKLGSGAVKEEFKRSLENVKDGVRDVIMKTSVKNMPALASLDARSKTKQKPAHSGVHCTPRKLIHCHSCKLKFRNVLDYTNHNLNTHRNKPIIQQPKF